MKLKHASTSFFFQLSLTSVLLLSANTWFLLKHHNIPDGRLFVLIPATSLVVLAVIACLALLSRLLQRRHMYLMTVFAGVLAALFMMFALRIQTAFQDMYLIPVAALKAFPYLGIFRPLPYLVIFGVGLAVYALSIIALKRVHRVQRPIV